MKLILLGDKDTLELLKDIAEETGQFAEVVCVEKGFRDPAEKIAAEAAALQEEEAVFFPAIQDNRKRLAVLRGMKEKGCRVANLLHPTAAVSRTVQMEEGVAVFQQAVIGPHCILKDGSLVGMGAILEMDGILKEGASVEMKAVVMRHNRIPSCLSIEAGEMIPPKMYPY